MNRIYRLGAVFTAFSVIFQLSMRSAYAQSTCQTTQSRDRQLEVSDCSMSTSRWVRITTQTGSTVRTQIAVEFPKSSLVWKKVQVVRGDGRLTVEDQSRLRELVSVQGSTSSEARSILEVLANFLEPNIAVENFDADDLAYRKLQQKQKQSHLMPETESNAFGQWTPICSMMGMMLTATYGGLDGSAGGPHQSLWPVGDYKTKCKGRCGWGCQQFLPQHRGNQYTMECFNHDVCHAEMGKQLGPCADAFWAAAASYAFAPDCPAIRR